MPQVLVGTQEPDLYDGRDDQRNILTHEKGAPQTEDEPATKSYAPFLKNSGWDSCIVPFPKLYANKRNSEYPKNHKESNNPSCMGQSNRAV